MQKIGIVGAGAWGTALAMTAVRAGREAILWAHEPEVAATIRSTQTNPVYLPGVTLEPCAVTSDLADLAGCDALLLVVPSQFLRPICRQLKPLIGPGVPVVVCAKGIEAGSLAVMSELVAEELPGVPLAVLSGPTFAIEVARGLPTAITMACADAYMGERLVKALGTPSFRPYLTDDVIGAEMGGAVKNVLAIACGVVEGRGLGDNARAALITRGMVELMRLAVAKGARPETCMGLSGLGDLMLTASSSQSRNYSLGYALGQGQTLEAILAARRSVTEGVATAATVVGLAAKLGIDMPICSAVEGLLHRGRGVSETIQGLMARPFKAELGFSKE
jgi:glycerol-3-phosphate dehydrogenase (NAD(P)+)